MSAAAAEPGSAVEFLERLVSRLLMRLLETESGCPRGVRPPNGAKQEAPPTLGRVSRACSLSHSVHTHTNTHTHTHTHTSLPSLEGLEGNVHVAFHGEQKKAKVLDTGQVSVSPASGSLQVAVGREPREMEEWFSGPHPGQAWLHV